MFIYIYTYIYIYFCLIMYNIFCFMDALVILNWHDYSGQSCQIWIWGFGIAGFRYWKSEIRVQGLRFRFCRSNELFSRDQHSL